MKDLGQMLAEWLTLNGHRDISKVKIEYDWQTGESNIELTRVDFHLDDEAEELSYVLSKFKLTPVESLDTN